MPVVGKVMSGAIMANFAGRRILGVDAIKIADAVGTAVAMHVTMPNMLTFMCTGVVGPVGTAQSIVPAGFIPKAMSALMMARALQVGFIPPGRDMYSLFDAIAAGVCLVMQTSLVQGTILGMAVGGGTAKFTKLNSQVLKGILYANFTARSILGKDAIRIADCIAFGVVNQLISTATYSIIVTGAIAPVPPVGPVAVGGVPAILSKVI